MNSSRDRINALRSRFSELFGVPPQVITRAPGRVNLIGEHTDYNEGYVLPIAIDRDILVAASPTSGREINIYSLDFDRNSLFSLDDISHDEKESWSNYPRGVASMLQEKHFVMTGANMAIQGNVPLGAGLSSSAAIEVACAMAFQTMNGFEMSGPDMALLSQAAENRFVGVNCGIMDQFISRLGAKNHALLVDCRTLEYELVPLAQGVKFVVADTRKKRALVDSEYNQRRAQCEEAVTILKTFLPGIKALRDVTPSDLRNHGDALPPIVRKRAEHIVHENARVLESVEALEHGQLERFGELMNQSHVSLRDLYEVSCEELDIMVEAAWKVPGVYGSRMTGGGFGGCTVSLVADRAIAGFLSRVSKEYETRTGITPELYEFAAEDGAKVVG